MNRKMLISSIAVLVIILGLAGCGKKKIPTPPAPPVNATLSASPDTIQAGQSTTLTWTTQSATSASIDQGIGKVDVNGSKTVSPAGSTTYTLTATDAAGKTATATATVTVATPTPTPVPVVAATPMPTPAPTPDFAANSQDVYFDYDKAEIRPSEQPKVAALASFLNANSSISVQIEGNADERGSTEYNLALGDKRANAVKEALVAAGVSADRLKTISYGKEKPVCTESNEDCWQKNRHDHFTQQ